MLKAIVQEVQLRLGSLLGELLLGEFAGFITAFSYDYGDLQTARDEERFVAEVGGFAFGVDYSDAAGFAAISAAEDVEGNAARFEEFA